MENKTDFLNDLSLIIRRRIDNENNDLNMRINDLRHMMNDQLIELKYGKNYTVSYLDDILIKTWEL